MDFKKKLIIGVGGFVGLIVLIIIIGQVQKAIKNNANKNLGQVGVVCNYKDRKACVGNILFAADIDENKNPIAPTQVFDSLTPKIYLVARLYSEDTKDVAAKYELQINWRGPNGKLIQKQSKVKINQIPGSKGIKFISSAPKPAETWPLGTYQVDIFEPTYRTQVIIEFKVVKPEEAKYSQLSRYLKSVSMSSAVGLDSRASGDHIFEFTPGQSISFGSTQENIYLSVLVSDPPGPSKVQTKWYNAQTAQQVYEATKTTDHTQYLAFNINRFINSDTPSKLWSEGAYYVEIYFNGTLITKVDYFVSGA